MKVFASLVLIAGGGNLYGEITYNDAALDAMIFGEEGELPKQSLWELASEMAVGIGYRENPFLREGGEESAAFLYADAQALARRPLIESGAEWSTVVWLENRQFEGLENFDRESLFFGQSRYGLDTELGEWYGSLRFLHLRRAFDASVNDFEVASETIEANRPSLEIGWQRQWRSFVFEVGAEKGQMRFSDPSDDYDSLRVFGGMDLATGERSGFELRLEGERSDYLRREARSEDGGLLEGPLLEVESLEGQVTWGRGFQRGPYRGRVEIGGSWEAFADSYSGFYDKIRARCFGELDLRVADWRVKLGARFGEQRYSARKVESGALKSDDATSWSLDLERRLGNGWTALLACEYSSNESNESLSSFRGNTVLIGLRLPGYSR